MPHPAFVCVTTTCDDAAALQALATSLVTARLVACAQWEPIQSVYRWQGQVETASEFRLTAKTSAARAGAVIAAIEAAHPYEVPEIIVTPIIAGGEAYLQWLETESAGEPD